MKVQTKQELGFADHFVDIPESELDVLEDLIDWDAVSKLLKGIGTDYNPLSLFRMMLLQTWHNMSDESIAQALRRDMVFIRFCGFSLSGKKPDAATLCRFRQKLVERKRMELLLRQVNKSIERKNLKVSKGRYVSADATLIGSARRPRKVFESRETRMGNTKRRKK